MINNPSIYGHGMDPGFGVFYINEILFTFPIRNLYFVRLEI
jgi:hypothetical protein